MNKTNKSSMIAAIFLSVIFLTGPVSLMADTNHAEGDAGLKPRQTSFYRDFSDSIFYERLAQFLRLDQVYRHLTFQNNKTPALDVNRFDEVPDSGFFQNRQGQKRLSASELKEGPKNGSGPDTSQNWKVTKGKTEGVTPGLFVIDGKGDKYLLKFDPADNPEMATAAEIISHKFFHAIGYNVPEYFIVKFKPETLVPAEGSTYYDENGFNQPLTQEAIQHLMEQPPHFKGGVVRASASKILPAPRLGYMDFDGKRNDDPDDLIFHEDRRSIRALRVFGSWLNHYDLRRSNTMDIWVSEGGKTYVKHYLIDFGSTLGSAAFRPKVPVSGYENIIDWYELAEEIPKFKVTEEAWEKKWDQSHRKIAYPEIGYFDNRHFDPGNWTTQLPYEAFDRLTVSDGFWASKIIMQFTDEDIDAVVGTGQYSDPEIANVLSHILKERRDLIGRYWFSQVTPLDQIQLFKSGNGKYEIHFSDLFVKYGFAPADKTQYLLKLSVDGKAGEEREFTGETVAFSLTDGKQAVLTLQAKHGDGKDWSTPALKIALTPGAAGSYAISEIDHGV